MEISVEELFAVCDKERKGFVVKRDMQRLVNELDLSPHELELVFDSLDKRSVGIVTLDEFALGFRHYVASQKTTLTCDGRNGKPSGKENQEDDINIASTLAQLDCSASDEQDIIRVLWEHFCQESEKAKRLFKELLERIWKKLQSKDDERRSLEEYCRFKTALYETHVEHLIEEMEQSIRLHKETTIREMREKKDEIIKQLQSELQRKDHELQQRTSQLENLQTLQQLSKSLGNSNDKGCQSSKTKARKPYPLENQLPQTERHLSEQVVRSSTSDDRSTRIPAFSVGEDNTAAASKSLVAQLSLLRSINASLLEERDIRQLSARSQWLDTGIANKTCVTRKASTVYSNGDATEKTEHRTDYQDWSMGSLSLHEELSICQGASPSLGVVKQGLKEHCIQPSNSDRDMVTLPGYDDEIHLGYTKIIEASQACNTSSSLTQIPLPKTRPLAFADNSQESIISSSKTSLHKFIPRTPIMGADCAISSLQNINAKPRLSTFPCPPQGISTPFVSRFKIHDSLASNTKSSNIHVKNESFCEPRQDSNSKTVPCHNVNYEERDTVRASPEEKNKADENVTDDRNVPYPWSTPLSRRKLFKVVLLGSSGVGKTCFFLRFRHDKFRDTCGTTAGIDFQSRCFVRGNETICLQLWDTAGQERFGSLTKQFFLRADGAIVMYNLTCDSSLQHARQWLCSVKDEAGENCALMLVGNKLDLVHQHIKERAVLGGRELAKEAGALFSHTSVKTGTGVARALLAMTDRLTQNCEKQH